MSEPDVLRVASYDRADLGDACLRDLAKSLDELTGIIDPADAAAVLWSRLGAHLGPTAPSRPGRSPASLRSLTIAALSRQRQGKPAGRPQTGAVAP